ncbi:MAG: hypothetical protein VX546_13725 [Myxococcota bacterium]|nr:hypothetical protein [Myxococcota bacterium]
MGCDAAEDQDGFSFEKRADDYGGVAIGFQDLFEQAASSGATLRA